MALQLIELQVVFSAGVIEQKVKT